MYSDHSTGTSTKRGHAERRRPFVTETEGDVRERLAAYFLTAPPSAEQDETQRARHRAALRELLALDNAAILGAAGMSRPLVRGDLAALLRAVLEACAAVADAARTESGPHALLTVHASPDFPAHETAVFEPRLIQAAAVGLLRAAVTANPDGAAAATLYAGDSSLILAVTGDRPLREPEALAVAKETARLHRGCLAVCDNTVGLSIPDFLPGEAGVCIVPAASELLRDALSSVQVGFYSSLG